MTSLADADTATQEMSSAKVNGASSVHEQQQRKKTTPNWRVISKTETGDFSTDDVLRIVQDRPDYSRERYDDALRLYETLASSGDSYVSTPIRAALNWLDHAYRLYGPESVVCSFNGGKDAVAILHLVRAAHANHYRNLFKQRQAQAEAMEAGEGNDTSSTQPPKLRMIRPRVIYFEHDDEFPEILDFLHASVSQYDLDMIAFNNGIKFQHGLKVLVDYNYMHINHSDQMISTRAPPISSPPFPIAFVLGTRSGDPNALNQDHFAPSSHYMPPFMRVNPILEWTYGHVWHFLRLFQLPYCILYDRGYTSLGTTKDTLPCPALAVPGMANGWNGTNDATMSIPKFWPAYMLRDWDQERAGRIDKKKDGAANKKEASAPKRNKPRRSKSVQSNISRTDSTVSVGGLSMLSELRKNVNDNNDDNNDKEDDDDDFECVSYSTDPEHQRTVGLLIVGNEILKGYTADSNTQAAASAMREQNVQLKRVVVVSDDKDEIVNEIHRLQKEVDVIITSGGVGPTHDDITIRSIAAALGLDMTLHEEMADLLRVKMKSDGAELTEAQTKMATLPSLSKLRYLSDKAEDWPILQCRNLFILPGIPEVFAYKIGHVAKYLSCQLERSVAYKVVLSVDEHSIVSILNRVVQNHPNVSIGSYPFVSQADFKTVLTIEGKLVTDGPPNTLTATTAATTKGEDATNGLAQTKGRSNSKIFDRELIDNSKRSMDHEVQLALDELITALPEGSVLRVDNDDMIFV